jgi:hypothetical protein
MTAEHAASRLGVLIPPFAGTTMREYAIISAKIMETS